MHFPFLAFSDPRKVAPFSWHFFLAKNFSYLQFTALVVSK